MEVLPARHAAPAVHFDPVLKKPASNSYKSQFRYVEDEEALELFFTTHSEGGEKPFMKQLEAIKRRARATFELRLDDMLDAKTVVLSERFQQLPQRIEAAVSSYTEHISRVVDRLLDKLPEPAAGAYARDTFDFLIAKDAERLRQQGADAVSGIPVQFRRRYRVVVHPPSASKKPKQVRQLTAACIGKLTILCGMCVGVSPVKPKIEIASYVCDQCNDCIYQEVLGTKYTPLAECPSDICKANRSKGRLFFEPRASKFTEYQEMRIQELPQFVPKGCVPRSIKVIVEGSAAGKAAPGSTVFITGVMLPDPKSGHAALRASAATRTYYYGFDVDLSKKAYSDILDNDAADKVGFVRSVMDDSSIVEKLTRSIAPEIYGLEDVKKVLACQLVGGVYLSREDGMKLRGDINICLMGDPGVAKSQLLKWVAHICPRSVFTTGKGSSGVGLTASVTIDEHTKEAVLEGGALVLADKGICCIDEFDKMDENDRTAIHEVMEQQTINIAKGGIITTLNARTSILAAANPRFGRWKNRKTPTQNINLPASLLSRFDVLWLLLDKSSDSRDQLLAKHITAVHMGEVGEHTSEAYGLQKTDAMFDKAFVRQFIGYAKTINPVLDQAVVSIIQNLYVEMRKNEQGQDATTYTTPRTLLAILRVSQALARLRLSSNVTETDVREAARLMSRSKESILESIYDDTSKTREGPIAQIFELIKLQKQRTNEQSIGLAAIHEAMAKKRLTAEHLESCLERYEKVGVFEVSRVRGVPVSITWV